MKLLDNVVNNLQRNVQTRFTESKIDYNLPFLKKQFLIEYKITELGTKILLMKDNQLKRENNVIGFREFHGPTNISPHTSDNSDYQPDFSPYFFGFKSSRSYIYPNGLDGLLEEGGSYALEVKKEYREKYSGIGKMLISVSIELMKRILQRKGKFNPEQPIFMSQKCLVPNMYIKYFGGKPATNYIQDPNDIVVFGNIICPEIKIKSKVF